MAFKAIVLSLMSQGIASQNLNGQHMEQLTIVNLGVILLILEMDVGLEIYLLLLEHLLMVVNLILQFIGQLMQVET